MLTHTMLMCPGLSNAAKAKTRTRAVVWLLIFTGFSYLTMDVLWTTITDILDYPITTTTDVTYKSEVHVFYEQPESFKASKYLLSVLG